MVDSFSCFPLAKSGIRFLRVKDGTLWYYLNRQLLPIGPQ
jgi:hypothetical protein